MDIHVQVMEGKLYHVGGRSLFYPQKYMEQYDIARDAWTVCLVVCLVHLLPTATSCNTLPTATSCTCTAYRNKLQHTATHLLPTATSCTSTAYCNTLQHIATHCNILQHIATHGKILQHTIYVAT